MGKRKTNDLQESFSFLSEKELGPRPIPPFDPVQLSRLAAEGVYLGTSSWKYRGWEGMIYKTGYSSEAQFQRQSLREYTGFFPCVGVDFTFYTWPMADMMSYLIDSTPENFRLFPKVTKRITMEIFPNIPTYGRWAGQKNPDFLKADLFKEQFLEPISKLGSRLGAIFFEFTHLGQEHLPRLQDFFRALPRTGYTYGLELRSPDLVRPEFYSLLLESGVSPVFNAWTKMPRIREQWAQYLEAGGAATKQPIMVRGLLRPGRIYEEAVQNFQPYKEIKDPYPEGREDIRLLMNFARREQRKAYIMINNRLEGCAPKTIGALLQDLPRGL